jgi:bla regulator protein blaR1
VSVTMLVVYVFAVAAVLALAAWFLERALTGLRLPARWVWIASLGLCIGLPLVAFVSGSWQRDVAVSISPSQTAAPIAQADDDVAAGGDGDRTLRPALGPLADWRAGLDQALASGAALLPTGDRVEVWTTRVWGAASILTAMVLLVSMRRLHRQANRWPDQTLFGHRVKLSPATGPATIGTFRSLVVIPRWARELPSHELELVLRHEGEHVRARDTLLLAMGLAAVVACPWNPLVWWQVRRLKEAVEVDCDRRVLRSGIAPARYGELLVRVGGRRPLGSLAVPAIAGSIPLLERRLTAMTVVRKNVSFPKVAAATAMYLFRNLRSPSRCSSPRPRS